MCLRDGWVEILLHGVALIMVFSQLKMHITIEERVCGRGYENGMVHKG